MGRARYIVEDLDESACRELLRRAPVGRIGFTHRALPRVLPVRFTVWGDEVVVARRHGATLDVRPQEIVAFEVDAFDPSTGDGWCVGLVGSCRLISDDDEIAELDAVDFAGWKSDEGSIYIGISISLIHGRVLTTTSPAKSSSVAQP